MQNNINQKKLSIGNTQVPAIGLGTYKLAGREGEKAIEYALGIGYRHIDTAEMYGNEQEVGNAIKHSGVPREEIFITTKVWPANFSKNKFMPSVEASVKYLQAGAVDLLLLHWPADDETNRLAVELLNECLHKQYAKHAGVSNFSIAQLKQAQKQAPIFCNQVEYSPYNNNNALLQYMQQQNLLLTAYSPLLRGQVLQEVVIKQLATKHNKTASQIVLRWLLQQDNVAAIPKASSEKHSLQNLQIFDFELSEADMQQIFALAK